MEPVGVGLGVLWVFFMLFIGALSIGGLVLWIWMLIDCATNEPSEGNDKIVWILIIVLANWLGALLYLVVRRPRRKAETGG